ncbi:MAG: hypothetical protein IKE28_10040 [Solobacterium sp.]|nr:hypothetical protein [Solobacterium sp.]
MKIKALNCPSCGATIDIQAGEKLVKCPYCDTTITATYDKNEQQMVGGTQFTDEKTGLPLGKAIIPEGWKTQGFMVEKQIDDITPFGTILNTYNSDQTMRMTTQFGEKWMQLLTNSILSMATPKQIRRNYLEPKAYLADLAARILNVSITPGAFGKLETNYSRNRSIEAQKIVGRFNENARIILPNIQCDYKLQNVLCDSYAINGRFQNQGKEWCVIMAADLYGLEFYDAAPMASLGRGLTSGIGKLFSGSQGDSSEFPNVFSETINAIKNGEESIFSMDFLRGGGLVGAMKRQKEKLHTAEINAQMNTGPVPQPQETPRPQAAEPAFGHAKEAGKPVDAIEWGAKRIYYAVGPAELEQDLIKKFMVFVGSFKQDQGIEQRLEQIHQQVRQQEMMSLQSATGYAMASQQANMMRQAQISQTLQQSSNIVMQGWENRQAAQSRMSDNFSQAIRGVDSYVTTDGRTVEHSVVSDHVYQNRYGDTIGVSGTGFSEQAMNNLGLTELDKKQ